MKTTSNTPKTHLNQVKKVIVRSSSIIACIVLISGSVIAQDFFRPFQSEGYNDKLMQLRNEPLAETVNAEISIPTDELVSELLIVPPLINNKYKSEEFVTDELAKETEIWKNGKDKAGSDTIEVEFALQMDLLMNSSKYEAGKFVEAEMAREFKILNSQDSFINKAEILTASECDQVIERFADNLIKVLERINFTQIAEVQTGN